jgi:GNAT superfamily N-acetyltransferase
VLDLQREAADGAASRALFAQYMALIAERMGAQFEPSEAIFGSEEAFAVPGAAWLVGYDDGRPVCCGGLRPLGNGAGEIKRMFVTTSSRRRGHGRRLLGELERLAAAGGWDRVRLLTTEALVEARALYAQAGYHVAETMEVGGHVDLWLEKALAPRAGREIHGLHHPPERSDMDSERGSAAGDIQPDDATPSGADSGEDAVPAPFETPDEDPTPIEERAQEQEQESGAT